MNYMLLGVSHKTAPLSVREKMAQSVESLESFLQHLLSHSDLSELVVISTCNRVEIYGAASELQKTLNELQGLLNTMWEVRLTPPLVYLKTEADVVSHLFSVVSSLDSMVVGENQISGQVKEAFKIAQKNNALGPCLYPLFHKAFSVAKRVKTETNIGKGTVSVGSVGVRLAKKIFKSDEDATLTLLGAGKIGESVLVTLKSEWENASVKLVNRTYARAQELENKGLGQAVPYENLWECLENSDILITSLGANATTLTHDDFVKLMARRKNASLFLMDLGVPRNIDPEVAKIENVYLYNVDDLQKIASESQKSRLNEMHEAKIIIDEESKAFYESYADNKTKPLIAKLNQKAEWIRKTEMEKTQAKLKHLAHEDMAAIEAMTQSMMKRILHDPILHLKTDEDATETKALQLVRKIFRLNDEEDI